MKKIIIIVLMSGLVGITSITSYASDWDKAGKALTIIEGVRVLTGGKIDLIGNITGINNQARYAHTSPRPQVVYHKETRYRCYDKVWVPHFKYVKKYIPQHEEYQKEHGNIIVEGHYVRYQVESGGHWETRDYCD